MTFETDVLVFSIAGVVALVAVIWNNRHKCNFWGHPCEYEMTDDDDYNEYNTNNEEPYVPFPFTGETEKMVEETRSC